MQVIGRRASHRVVAPGSDEVLIGYPLPALGSFNSLHVDCRIIGPEDQSFLTAHIYGASAFILPVLDPDSGALFQDIWDAQVPKDVELSAGGFDIDTAALDTTPEFEIGTPDPSAFMKLGQGQNMEMFRRRTLVTVHGNPVSAATPDAYLPLDRFNTDIRRHVEVDSPSVFLLGLSAPDTASTTQSERTIPTEIQWTLLQYLEVTLEQAMMNFIGLTEAGAETPYTESMAFIASLIEEDVFEESANAFAASAWNAFTLATFNISSQGSVDVGVLTSE